MNVIREYFEQIVKINDIDWKIFSSKLKKAQYKKRETILKKGEIENYLNFIEKGSIRLFIPKEENDLTFGFVLKINL
ncbi:hypothetical protein GCM10007384_25470 [Aquimarina muelleri]|uniref:Cyclic nucleotide-binding domain-containing protein n=1 Tax=Aquimarina muelleri TaxID=279356 RepID=A0A918N4K1_9FLAO|nr:hypothetical protein GCM10007384_25470 [Aquimarina muelleri]